MSGSLDGDSNVILLQLACGSYHALFPVSLCVLTLQVLCKYVSLFTIDRLCPFCFMACGSFCGNCALQPNWHSLACATSPPVILSPPSLCGTQPSKTSDRQANGNSGLQWHNILSLPPPDRCLASVCKHAQQGNAENQKVLDFRR